MSLSQNANEVYLLLGPLLLKKAWSHCDKADGISKGRRLDVFNPEIV